MCVARPPQKAPDICHMPIFFTKEYFFFGEGGHTHSTLLSGGQHSLLRGRQHRHRSRMHTRLAPGVWPPCQVNKAKIGLKIEHTGGLQATPLTNYGCDASPHELWQVDASLLRCHKGPQTFT